MGAPLLRCLPKEPKSAAYAYSAAYCRVLPRISFFSSVWCWTTPSKILPRTAAYCRVRGPPSFDSDQGCLIRTTCLSTGSVYGAVSFRGEVQANLLRKMKRRSYPPCTLSKIHCSGANERVPWNQTIEPLRNISTRRLSRPRSTPPCFRRPSTRCPGRGRGLG